MIPCGHRYRDRSMALLQCSDGGVDPWKWSPPLHCTSLARGEWDKFEINFITGNGKERTVSNRLADACVCIRVFGVCVCRHMSMCQVAPITNRPPAEGIVALIGACWRRRERGKHDHKNRSTRVVFLCHSATNTWKSGLCRNALCFFFLLLPGECQLEPPSPVWTILAGRTQSRKKLYGLKRQTTRPLAIPSTFASVLSDRFVGNEGFERLFSFFMLLFPARFFLFFTLATTTHPPSPSPTSLDHCFYDVLLAHLV